MGLIAWKEPLPKMANKATVAFEVTRQKKSFTGEGGIERSAFLGLSNFREPTHIPYILRERKRTIVAMTKAQK